MIDSDIFQMYEDLTDGQSTVGNTLKVQLANIAKNKIETDIKPQCTKKLDTSLTATVGGTYLTAYNLPTDFLTGLTYIYVGCWPYFQVPFDQRETYRDTPRCFYIDMTGTTKKFYLTGTQTKADTITIPYYAATTDFTSVTSSGTTLTWPDRFHPLVAIEMAKTFYAVDAGDKARAWDDRWAGMYQELKSQFENYEAAFKLASISNSTPYGGDMDVFSAPNQGIPLNMM